MQNRTRDYYRKQRKSHIDRKKRIIKDQNDYWHYKYDGVLSKGKIHCSCWMCRHKFYQEAAMSDVRKAISAIDKLVDSGFGYDLIEHIKRRTRTDKNYALHS